MPIDYSKYAPNWHAISKRIRFERAGNQCEICGAENGKPHPVTGSKVVLTVAHLDHDVSHNDDANLKAMCQKCHLTYDGQHHAQNAKRTRAENRQRERRVSGQLELFKE